MSLPLIEALSKAGGTGAITLSAGGGLLTNDYDIVCIHTAINEPPSIVSSHSPSFTQLLNDNHTWGYFRFSVFYRRVPENNTETVSIADSGNHTFAVRFRVGANSLRFDYLGAHQPYHTANAWLDVNNFVSELYDPLYVAVLFDGRDSGTARAHSCAVHTNFPTLIDKNYHSDTALTRLDSFASNAGSGGGITIFSGSVLETAYADRWKNGIYTREWEFSFSLDTLSSSVGLGFMFSGPLGLEQRSGSAAIQLSSSVYASFSLIPPDREAPPIYFSTTSSLLVSGSRGAIVASPQIHSRVSEFVAVAKKGAFGSFNAQLQVTGAYGGSLFQEAQRSVFIPLEAIVAATFSVSSEAEDKYRDAVISLASMISLSGKKGSGGDFVTANTNSVSSSVSKWSSFDAIFLNEHSVLCNYHKIVGAIASVLSSSWTESIKPHIAYRDMAVSVLSRVDASFFRDSFGEFSVDERAALVATAIAQTEFILQGFSEINIDARREFLDSAATRISQGFDSRKGHIDADALRLDLDSETKRRLSVTAEGRRILEHYYSAMRLEGGN